MHHTAPVAIGALEKLRPFLRQHPALLRLPLAYAINRDYARADSELKDGDEVAFIPPISGGAGAADWYRFDLVDGVIDPRPLETMADRRADGGVAA